MKPLSVLKTKVVTLPYPLLLRRGQGKGLQSPLGVPSHLLAKSWTFRSSPAFSAGTGWSLAVSPLAQAWSYRETPCAEQRWREKPQIPQVPPQRTHLLEHQAAGGVGVVLPLPGAPTALSSGAEQSSPLWSLATADFAGEEP